jgi:hypothetical protein
MPPLLRPCEVCPARAGAPTAAVNLFSASRASLSDGEWGRGRAGTPLPRLPEFTPRPVGDAHTRTERATGLSPAPLFAAPSLSVRFRARHVHPGRGDHGRVRHPSRPRDNVPAHRIASDRGVAAGSDRRRCGAFCARCAVRGARARSTTCTPTMQCAALRGDAMQCNVMHDGRQRWLAGWLAPIETCGGTSSAGSSPEVADADAAVTARLRMAAGRDNAD